MNSAQRLLVAAAIMLFSGTSAFGGCWVDLYWPLNGGDVRYFTRNVSVGTDYQEWGEYWIWQDTPDDYVHEIQRLIEGKVYFDCADSGWIRVCVSPDVLLFDDILLQNGGSRTTRTTARQSGVSYRAVFTVTVSSAGTVTVPAGTFHNCRNVTVKETAYPPGQPAVTANLLTAVLAPRVGMIKKRATVNRQLVWVELVSGYVGGMDVTGSAALSGTLPPRITAGPRNTTATNHSSIALTVSASGQELGYQWLRSGVPLSDDGRVTGATTRTLRIEPVQPGDAGIYAVQVSNTVCSVTSTNAVLFVNPFPPVAGNYNGLFYHRDSAEHQSSGSFKATVQSAGAFSATLQTGSGKYPFTGRFDLGGTTTNTVTRPGTNSLVVELWLDLNGSNQLTGRVTDGAWSSELLADRAVFHALSRPATNFAGKFTLLIPGGTLGSVAEPAGDGFAALTISPAGVATLAGTLADGTPAGCKVPISIEGDLPLYVSLYGGTGAVLGWLRVRPSTELDLNGDVAWFKPPRPLPPVYTNGFTLSSSVSGSAYKPFGTNRLFPVEIASLVFNGTGLSEPITNWATVGPNGRLTNSGPHPLTFRAISSNGLFSGSIVLPGETTGTTYKGALLQRQGYASGYFMRNGQSGHVRVQP